MTSTRSGKGESGCIPHISLNPPLLVYCSLFGQKAGPIGTKLGIRIYLDPGNVLGKSRSRSRSERCRREKGGTVGTEAGRI